MSAWQTAAGVVGMGLITIVTRGFFLILDRELPMPHWAMRGLRYAPLAALAAVIAPEIVLTNGALVATWHDARLYSVIAGTAVFLWRRSILGTIVSGTAVMLALRIGLGW